MTSVTQGRRSRRILSTPPESVAELTAHELQAPWSCDLDHAGLDVGSHQDEITPVGLHGRPHQVHDPLELVQAIGPLGVAQLGSGVGHPSILPCPRPSVTSWPGHRRSDARTDQER